MKVFVTGGTGFIGTKLVERLVSENHEVAVLLRRDSFPEFAGREKISFIMGDLFDEAALKKGVTGCDWVFHLAAFTKPWAKDPLLIARTNVTGTINVLEAAKRSNVRKVIITSTAGTMGHSYDGTAVGERTNTDPLLHTLYEKTKAEAEKIAIDYSRKGLNIVIVNPTRVYGPGILSESNSMTKILKSYISGWWRIIPGNGHTIGNYVFIDDVVSGHILAARSGRSGERYILGGENVSFREFFRIAGEVSGTARHMISLPFGLLKGVIKIIRFFSRISGIPPVITMEWLDKYSKDWILSGEKANQELGYIITPLREGIFKTVNWIKSQ